MKIVSIGLGEIAQKAYLPIMSCTPDVQLALCTRNESTRSMLAKQYRIENTFDHLDQVTAFEPDAVMIHSNTASHFEIARQCLQQGIAVFVDKPLSYSLSETETLLDLSEQKNTLLMVGFNRRYAPLYEALRQNDFCIYRYQKNRTALADQARRFVFDDFIHVIDLAMHLTGGLPDSPEFRTRVSNKKLAYVDVRWQSEGMLVDLSMNRLAGQEEELLEAYGENQHWRISALERGVYTVNGEHSELGFNHWESTLVKRGFQAMIDDFLSKLVDGGSDSALLQSYQYSHRLCEEISLSV